MIYLKIEGATQGLISSDCNSRDSMGNRYQSAHKDEISVFSTKHSLREFAEQHNTQSDSFSITKLVDKSSPLLGMAFSKQEKLQCELAFYRTNENGYNECFYTVLLKDALISRLSFSLPHVIKAGKEDLHEVIAFTYKEIIWKHLISGTEGYAQWER